MNRYSKTERLGVIETDKIVTKNLGWIFREQPIVDVGIDAIIEVVKEYEPTGKFIAVQIKSGSGNFYKTDKYLSYYVTNIHYNYWLNLCIPIIIIAHVPEEDKTYWQEITEKNCRKTKKKWLIEIPLSQEFNEKSERRLLKIASDKNDEKFNIHQGRADSREIDDIFDDLNSIKDATVCLNNISLIMNLQTNIVEKNTEYLKLQNERSERSTIYKSVSKTMNLTSKRIETEVEIFSQVYSVGIIAFEKMLINLENLNLKYDDLVKEIDSLKQIPSQMDFAVCKYENLVKTIAGMPTYNYTFFKEAKNRQIEVLDFFIRELKDGREIMAKIFEKI